MDTFDFFTVKLHATRKNDIYATMGGRNEELRRRIKAVQIDRRRYGSISYPVFAYELALAFVDVAAHPDSTTARARAEAIAATYSPQGGAYTLVRYNWRD